MRALQDKMANFESYVERRFMTKARRAGRGALRLRAVSSRAFVGAASGLMEALFVMQSVNKTSGERLWAQVLRVVREVLRHPATTG